MSRLAQVAIEYLIIIALAFAILIPTGYFFYSYSQTSSEGTVKSQINQLGSKMLSNAQSIYGLGEGSLVTLEFNYPSNIRDVYILNQNELIISYEVSTGLNDAVFFSKVPISGPYNYSSAAPCSPLPCNNSQFGVNKPYQGNHVLKFESRTSYVLINLTQ